ncbi:MAG: serine hydrolase [Candidatus Dormibacteraeota bacterium]|nr:serine hydrolase [Candidatus Dormibacteraeota bacterium]
MGAGDAWSTTGDVARWDAAPASGTLLSPTSRRAMLAIQAPDSGGRLSGRRRLRIRLVRGRMSGRRAFYHTGDNRFIALNAWFPGDDWRLIVLANDDSIDGELVIKELLVRMVPLPE